EPARPVAKITSNLYRPFLQSPDVLALESGVTFTDHIGEGFEADQVGVRKVRDAPFEQLAHRRHELRWRLGREGQLQIADIVGQIREERAAGRSRRQVAEEQEAEVARLQLPDRLRRAKADPAAQLVHDRRLPHSRVACGLLEELGDACPTRREDRDASLDRLATGGKARPCRVGLAVREVDDAPSVQDRPPPRRAAGGPIDDLARGRGGYGFRHLSRLPPLVLRTRSTRTLLPGFISRARSIAAPCVGSTALARSAFGLRTA